MQYLTICVVIFKQAYKDQTINISYCPPAQITIFDRTLQTVVKHL